MSEEEPIKYIYTLQLFIAIVGAVTLITFGVYKQFFTTTVEKQAKTICENKIERIEIHKEMYAKCYYDKLDSLNS